MGRRMRCSACGKACDEFSPAMSKASPSDRVCLHCEEGQNAKQQPSAAQLAPPPPPPKEATPSKAPTPQVRAQAPPVREELPAPAAEQEAPVDEAQGDDEAGEPVVVFPPGTYVNSEIRAFFTLEEGGAREIAYSQGDNELRGNYSLAEDDEGPFLAMNWKLHTKWSGPDDQEGTERELNDEASAAIMHDDSGVPGLLFNEKFFHFHKPQE